MNSKKTKTSGRSIWVMVALALLAGLFALWFVQGRQDT